MSSRLIKSREGRLLRLTLNRPEKRNALDMEMGRALIDALEEANKDRSLGAILLDAEGDTFCAGMDLAEVLEGPRGIVGVHRLLFTINKSMKKPLVAAVQGSAFGGGLGLALNAHFVMAASDAHFGLTEIKVGLWPYMIFHAVEAAVGLRRATSLALTGRVMGAVEAREFGIVDEVVPPEELSARAHALALELSEGSNQAQSMGIEFVKGERSIGVAAEFRARAQELEDFVEGAKAFLEKRPPVWPSHTVRPYFDDEEEEV